MIPTAWLVVGIGNPLRRDDGLGAWVVEQVADWRLPGVRTLVETQLLPEMADAVASAARVVFVDAAVSTDQVVMTSVAARPTALGLGHAFGPEELLQWAHVLYGARPHASLVRVPGFDFDHGDRLSAAGLESAREALFLIRELLTTPGRAADTDELQE